MEPWNWVLVYHRNIVTEIATAGRRCRNFWIHGVQRGCDVEGAVEAVNPLCRGLLPGIGRPGAGEVGKACTMVLAMAARENELSLVNTL